MAGSPPEAAALPEAPAICEIDVSDLAGGHVVRRVVDEVEILAVETPAGIRVYSGVCPHLGGPLLEGAVREGRVRCPWHAYEFDLATGACLTPPGRPWWGLCGVPEPFRGQLVPLPFERDGDVLRVRLRRR